MKLHKFVAPTTSKAIFKVHAELGAEALVYSTRSVNGEVEILAGLPHSHAPESSRASMIHDHSELPTANSHSQNMDFMEQMNKKLQKIHERVDTLSNKMKERDLDDEDFLDLEYRENRNYLYHYLGKLGFRGQFFYEFANEFLLTHLEQNITESLIDEELLSHIKVDDIEFIDKNNICALIGPTGIGKTTTILKLAKRYIAKYGSASLGIVTTDYNIAAHNHLLHYCHLLNVDVEYANTEKELSLVLREMKNKRLVLIDTHGASQRDHDTLASLLSLIESQDQQISSYMVLPCNVQESILDEIARAFKTVNLKGCILTKQDECINIAPVINIVLKYKMNISYICHGQNINKDIEHPNAEMILYRLIKDSIGKKKTTEDLLFKNMERVANHAHMREFQYRVNV